MDKPKNKTIDDYLRDYLLSGKAEGQIVEQDYAKERKKSDILDYITAGSKAATGLGTLGGVSPTSTTPELAQNMKKNVRDYINRKEMQKSSIAPSVLSYLARSQQKELTPEESELMKARSDKLRAEASAMRNPEQNPRSILDMLRLERLGQQLNQGKMKMELDKLKLSQERKKSDPQTPEEKWEKLPGEQKVKASLLSTVLREAIKAKKELEKIKDQKPETQLGQIIGSVAPMYQQTRLAQGGATTPFMNAKSDVIDALGKFRSGAALNASEEQRYSGFTPNIFTDPDRADEMLDRLIRNATADIQGYGLSIQDVLEMRDRADREVQQALGAAQNKNLSITPQEKTLQKSEMSREQAQKIYDKFKDRLDELSPSNRAKALDAFTQYGFPGFESR